MMFDVSIVRCVAIHVDGIEATTAKKAIEIAHGSSVFEDVLKEIDGIPHCTDTEETSHYLVDVFVRGRHDQDHKLGGFYHADEEPTIRDVLRPLVKWYSKPDAEDYDDKLEEIVVAAKKILNRTV